MSDRSSKRLLTQFLVGLASLAGCGNEVVPGPSLAGLTLLVRQEVEPAGARCPFGGTLVHAGLDTDRDTVLDPEEIAKTEVACGSGPGEPPAVLARTRTEPAGASCAEGGTRVEAGRDVNGDGTLDDAEVEETTYLCRAPTPAPPPMLTRVTPVTAGPECPFGGSTVGFGPDLDLDGALADAEVTGTRVLCEVRAAPGFRVTSQADADLVSAADVVDGWLDIEIHEALDINLFPSAITGGVVVRGAGLAGLGIFTRVIGEGVTVEANPGLKRFWLSSSTVLGGDVLIRDNPLLDSLLLPNGPPLLGLRPYRYPGHLVISGNGALVAFSFLHPVEVGGSLVIESNPALQFLFFDGLQHVGGDFVLADNDAMEEYPSLNRDSLQGVRGTLVIRDNANLILFGAGPETLGGLTLARNSRLGFVRLPRVQVVTGNVLIEDNDSFLFSDGPGVDPLRFVGGGVTIRRNASLGGLGQISGLVAIGGRLEVTSNPALQRLRLENLVAAAAVVLDDNPLLAIVGPTVGHPLIDPPSLVRLERVAELSVRRNATLAHLVLPSLVTGGTVIVNDNPKLPTCEALALPAATRTVSGNDDTATCP